MDNARIHHYRKFVDDMKNINKNIIYNIPYSPQFNPIEYVFNVLKMTIRKSNIDTFHSLQKCIDSFVKQMNVKSLRNYFQKSYNDLFA